MKHLDSKRFYGKQQGPVADTILLLHTYKDRRVHKFFRTILFAWW